MAATTPRVTVHMVASLDGFIARKDGSVSWLETSDSYEKGTGGEDAEAFLETVDCFVVGSRTYETALSLGWPYGDVPTSLKDVTAYRNGIVDLWYEIRA